MSENTTPSPDWLVQPYQWHRMPIPSPQEFAEAIIHILRTVPGQILLQGLIHKYLLSGPDDMASGEQHLGAQGVIQHVLMMQDWGLRVREQRDKEVGDGGRASGWYINGDQW